MKALYDSVEYEQSHVDVNYLEHYQKISPSIDPRVRTLRRYAILFAYA